MDNGGQNGWAKGGAEKNRARRGGVDEGDDIERGRGEKAAQRGGAAVAWGYVSGVTGKRGGDTEREGVALHGEEATVRGGYVAPFSPLATKARHRRRR